MFSPYLNIGLRVLWGTHFSLRGCMKLAPAVRGSQKARFKLSLLEKNMNCRVYIWPFVITWTPCSFSYESILEEQAALAAGIKDEGAKATILRQKQSKRYPVLYRLIDQECKLIKWRNEILISSPVESLTFFSLIVDLSGSKHRKWNNGPNGPQWSVIPFPLFHSDYWNINLDERKLSTVSLRALGTPLDTPRSNGRGVTCDTDRRGAEGSLPLSYSITLSVLLLFYGTISQDG